MDRTGLASLPMETHPEAIARVRAARVAAGRSASIDDAATLRLLAAFVATASTGTMPGLAPVVPGDESTAHLAPQSAPAA